MYFLRSLLLTILLSTSVIVLGQNSMGVGTSSPNHNAVLELVSPGNDQGFLVPRLTTSQRTTTTFTDNLTTTDQGLLVFDTEESQFFFWSGAEWLPMSSTNLNLTAGEGVEISDQGLVTNVGDLDDTNELLDINNTQLTGTTLEITDAGGTISIDLSSLQDGTGSDNQDLSLSGTALSLTNDGTSVDLSTFLDNTDAQEISLAGNSLSLSNDPTPVDLSSYLDNTDAQSLAFAGNQLTIANGNTVDLSPLINDADADPQNEIQDLQLASNILTITGNASATEINLAPFAGTNTDEQTLTLTGSNLAISGGNTIDISSIDTNTQLGDTDIAGFGYIKSPNDADADASNEIQSLSYNGTTNELSLTSGGTVDLSDLQDSFTDNDNQDLSLSGNTLSLTNDGTPVNLSGYLDNTDAQSLTYNDVSYSLSLSNGGAVDLSGLAADNVDDADASPTNEIQDLNLTGNTLTITGNGSATPIDLSPFAGTDTDDQTLSLVTNTLSISEGNSVDLSGYLDNTDNQSLAYNNVSYALSLGNGGTVDLSGLAVDNVNDADADASNEIQSLSYNGTTNVLSLTSGGTVDLSDLQDSFTDTDDQTLSLATNTLSISEGNSVNLSVFLDNTDNQSLAYNDVSYALSLANGGSVDLSGLAVDNVNDADADASNEIQSLSYNGTTNELSLTSGGTVNLSDLQDSFTDTDDQTLSLVTNTLSISEGNSVNLAAYLDNTDNQTASDVPVSPTGNLGSNNTQAALVELQGDIDGLGTAAGLDVGAAPNNVVQLDGSGRLPAVDGSLLTGTTPWGESAGVLSYNSTNLVGVGTTNPYNEFTIQGVNSTPSTSDGIFMDVVNQTGIVGALSGIRFKKNSVSTNERFNAGIFYDGDNLILSAKQNTATNIATTDQQISITPNGAILYNSPEVEDNLTNNLNPILTLNRTGGGTSVTSIRYRNSNTFINAGINANDEFAVSATGSNLGVNEVMKINGTGNFAFGENATISSLAYMSRFVIPASNTDQRYALRIENNSGSAFTNYGLFLSNGGSATTRYGVYSTGETRNYLAGDLGLGTTNPSAKLDIVGDAEVNGTLRTTQNFIAAPSSLNIASTSYTLNHNGRRVIRVRNTFASTNAQVLNIQAGEDGQELLIINIDTDTNNIINFRSSDFGYTGTDNILVPGNIEGINTSDVIKFIYSADLGAWVMVSKSSNDEYVIF